MLNKLIQICRYFFVLYKTWHLDDNEIIFIKTSFDVKGRITVGAVLNDSTKLSFYRGTGKIWYNTVDNSRLTKDRALFVRELRRRALVDGIKLNDKMSIWKFW